jgi:hypothetical protein
MHFSSHLVKFAKSYKNPEVKLYKLSLEMCSSKNQFTQRPESNQGPWPKTREIFKFYDGSAIGFYFEKGIPVRAEDYGAITASGV